jgi:hypothetical protein
MRDINQAPPHLLAQAGGMAPEVKLRRDWQRYLFGAMPSSPRLAPPEMEP